MACGDCAPNPHTMRATPTRMRASRRIRGGETGSRHSSQPITAKDTGVVPAMSALTCAAEVNLPPSEAIRKKGSPAPQATMTQHFTGSARSAVKREGRKGASASAGTRKRISATSVGARLELPMARIDSEKLAQITSVRPIVSQPTHGRGGAAIERGEAVRGWRDFMAFSFDLGILDSPVQRKRSKSRAIGPPGGRSC